MPPPHTGQPSPTDRRRIFAALAAAWAADPDAPLAPLAFRFGLSERQIADIAREGHAGGWTESAGH